MDALSKNSLKIIWILLPLILSASTALAGCADVVEGQAIQMGERDCLRLRGSDYVLKLNKFYTNHCLGNSNCIPSEKGIDYTHEYQGQIMQGINLIQAFAFNVTVHKTDHRTFALISVTKKKP